MPKEYTTTNYSHLRKLAEQRSKRLEQAGFTGYHAPKVRELDGNIAAETRKLEKWLNKETATVTGARAVLERRQAAEEERRERRRERERERRREKAEAEGRTYKERPPKPLTDEERRERRREQNRQYRERQRERQRELNEHIGNIAARYGEKAGQRMSNLLNGLGKWGIHPKNADELEAWRKYINEREKDHDKAFYEFDKWIADVADQSGKRKGKINADDIYNLLNDFNQWQADQAGMQAEFERERQPNEYGQGDFGLWSSFMHSGRFK